MTEEQLKAFEKELSEIQFPEGAHYGDPPRYVLTGEVIPEEILKLKQTNKDHPTSR